MDTDRENFARDETLINRRPWYVLAARIRQHVSQPRAFFGETLSLAISVENQKLLPLPWLEIEDEIPEQLTLLTGRAAPTYKVNRAALVNTFSLWSFQRVTRRYRLRCTARGVYTFGPATARCGDPFGWLTREERVQARETLLIYPLVAPIESFGLPPRYPFGEQATPRRLLEDPLRIAGVREYALGDDPRRIHWKATARAGELRSKIYEPSSQYRLFILLDFNTYKESWMGLDPEIQELTISAAASLAMWALDEGYAVGLLANSLMMGLSGESASTGDEQAISSVAAAGTFIHRVRVPMARGQRTARADPLGAWPAPALFWLADGRAHRCRTFHPPAWDDRRPRLCDSSAARGNGREPGGSSGAWSSRPPGPHWRPGEQGGCRDV